MFLGVLGNFLVQKSHCVAGLDKPPKSRFLAVTPPDMKISSVNDPNFLLAYNLFWMMLIKNIYGLGGLTPTVWQELVDKHTDLTSFLYIYRLAGSGPGVARRPGDKGYINVAKSL